MRSILHTLACCALVAISNADETTTTKVCPLLGPVYPFPTGLSSNEHFQRATKKIEAALNTSLATGISPNDGAGPFQNTTFSVGVFSTTEKDLIYQFHYTDPSVRNSLTGTHNVDADSIYRLGSIGKVLSVYIFLIRDGDVHWNDPITKYIPELAAAMTNTTSSISGLTNWSEITVGQLASHLSGLPHDFGLSDTSYPWLSHTGLPQVPESQIPSCNIILLNSTYIPCTRQQYLSGLISEPPLFQSGSTPAYSNNAFVLLALALEKITGDDLGKIFNESLVEALDLPRTSFDVPSSTQFGVIPGDPTTAGWDSVFEVFAAAGGYFSSTNDMAAIGKAILNSTLLSKAQTRRWLKPATFTANVNMGVGYPWEIYRTQVSGRTVDLYAKNGGWGAYSTEIVLVPDYEFGFVVLTAAASGTDSTTPLVYQITEMVGSEVLPVLEEVAKDQANAAFAGNYTASNLNSTLTITVDDQPGLRVTQWISNGTDLFNDVGLRQNGTYVDFRLQPNQLYAGNNQVGFTASYEQLPRPIITSPLDVSCVGWASVDPIIYGNIGLGDFVFEIDPATGKAISAQLRALRITLEKQA